MKVDLDKLDHYADMIWATTAELRAAREVVKAARQQPRTTKGNAAAVQETAYISLDVALTAYDKAVGP